MTYEFAAYRAEDDVLMATATQTLVLIDLDERRPRCRRCRDSFASRSPRSSEERGALEAIDRILNRGGDVDDVLREVVEALVEHGGCAWAGILFAEQGELVLGRSGRTIRDARRPRCRSRSSYRGDARVPSLVVDGCH